MTFKPKITVVLAMTADGKIADRDRSPARFGSSSDKAHLEQQIAAVDAVIFGANTLRTYGTTLSISNPELLALRQKTGRSPQPIQIVCSASGKLDRHCRFFSQPVPRWLLTTPQGAQIWQEKGNFDRILSGKSKIIDWQEILTNLSALGIETIAVLGGGELVASLLAVDAIDELWLTVCPFIFGGIDAPTPVGGLGLTAGRSKRLELLEVRQIGNEVFLHYRFLLPDSRNAV
jgi:5-amino-6-(5-phosphoribosylamino)uracil reductase